MAPRKQNIPKQFAALYVNGPEGLRGNWEACERQLKKKISNTQEVREAILAEGGSLGDRGEMPLPPKEFIEILPIDLPEVDLTKFTDVQEDASQAEWMKLAKELEPTIKALAKGEVKASAAQTAIIKSILDRAYGRIGQKEQTVSAAGVIILPALGERSEMFVCPNCSYRVEKANPRKEE